MTALVDLTPHPEDVLFRDALDLAALGLWEWDLGRDQVRLDPRSRALYGLADAAPTVDAWRGAIAPDDRMRADQDLLDLTPKEPRTDLKLRLTGDDGQDRWIRERVRVSLWRGDRPERLVGIVSDVTAEHDNENRRRELAQELQHRIKNILAVVRALARRTVESSASLDDFGARFEGRLSALGRVQTALARTRSGQADLETLLRDELLETAALDDVRVDIQGPPVGLRGRMAEMLALALHELVANAVQHGAFASEQGLVTVSWDIGRRDGRNWLSLAWRERVPNISIAEPEGFGRDFLEQALPYALEGTSEISMTPHGLEWSLTLPMAEGP